MEVFQNGVNYMSTYRLILNIGKKKKREREGNNVMSFFSVSNGISVSPKTRV